MERDKRDAALEGVRLVADGLEQDLERLIAEWPPSRRGSRGQLALDSVFGRLAGIRAHLRFVGM